MICSVLAGMSTERWLQLPVVTFVLADLIPTQDLRGELWPERRPHPAACADPFIHVISCRGNLYVEDGHHRRARAIRQGRTLIDGRLLRCAAVELHVLPAIA